MQVLGAGGRVRVGVQMLDETKFIRLTVTRAAHTKNEAGPAKEHVFLTLEISLEQANWKAEGLCQLSPKRN